MTGNERGDAGTYYRSDVADETPRIHRVNDDQQVCYIYQKGNERFYLQFIRKSGALRVSSHFHTLEELARVKESADTTGIVQMLLPPGDEKLELTGVKNMDYDNPKARIDTPKCQDAQTQPKPL